MAINNELLGDSECPGSPPPCPHLRPRPPGTHAPHRLLLLPLVTVTFLPVQHRSVMRIPRLCIRIQVTSSDTPPNWGIAVYYFCITDKETETLNSLGRLAQVTEPDAIARAR